MDQNPDTDIRTEFAETIHQAFPDDVLVLVMDIQESYLAEVFPRLKARLLQLEDTAIRYERDPQGGPGWSAGEGRLPPDSPEEIPDPADLDRPYSYYLFFVAPTAEMFRFGAEDPDDHEEGSLTVGYCVALSVLAPVAMIALTHMEEDHFTHTIPDIVPDDVEDADGRCIGIADFCREKLPEEGIRTLHDLRERIIATLEPFAVKVIPEEELKKRVPWLKLPGMGFLGRAQVDLTVRDAFFFWGF